MTNLDLSKFPEIETIHGLLLYDPFKEFETISQLGDISERIYGCSTFLATHPDEKYPFFSEKAYLRGFVNEFSSLNEILKAHANIELQNISIEKTDYPLFHFIKLIRNINFHIKSIKAGHSTFQAVYVNKITKEESEEEFTINRFIIDECNIELLKAARDFRHYKTSDLQKTLEWIETNQKVYGINGILEEALRQYCRLIINTVANTRLA